MAATDPGRVTKSTGAFLALGLAVMLGMALALVPPEPGERQAIEWLDPPRSLRSFHLESEAGEFNRQSVMGHWTIVVFGFLNCPDICPTSLAQLAMLANNLAGEPGGEKVNYVFVSVDPGRDSVTDIGQYVRHFDPGLLGVTGSEEQLTQFAGDLGVRFKVSSGEDDYAVAHSITFSIIGPQGSMRGRFRSGFELPALVRSFSSRLQSPPRPP